MIYFIILVGALVLAPAPTSYASDIIVPVSGDDLESGSDDDLESGSGDNLESVSGDGLESVSGDNLESVSGDDPEYANDDDLFGDIMPLLSYDAQSATISTDIVNYFRGIVSKLPFGYHYVLFRSGTYQYIFAYGFDLSFNGSQFIGTSIDVITYNSQASSYSYTHGIQPTFSLRPLNGLVYTDLVEFYPSLSVSTRQLLYLAVISGLIWTMGNFIKFGGARFARKKFYR